MTIEILKSKNPLVVERSSQGWIQTAMLFMNVSATIGADRVVPLSSGNGRTCSLHTFTNPANSVIDTIGQIEIAEAGKVIETIPLDASNPVYVCSEDLGEKGYAVEQVVRYKPFQIR